MTVADEDALVEAMAALAHEQWGRWLNYLFDECPDDDYGQVVIPRPLVQRWQRQMGTFYADLPEEERESDRAEARRVLAVLAAEREHAAHAARQRIYIILAGVLDSLDQAEHLTDKIMALVAGKEDA